MPVLYTITGNLLAETTAYYLEDRKGETQRAYEERFQVGGKGINASRLMALVGGETMAVYFGGGAVGERCRSWLEQQAFPSKSFIIEGETRSGWVVRAQGQPETTYLGKDISVSAEAWATALNWIGQQAREGDGVVLCGSVPGWNEALAKQWEHFVRSNVGRLQIGMDSYGPPLKTAASLPLSIIKINRKEFSQLIAEEVTDATIQQQLAKVGREYPVSNWLVTNGPGALFGITEKKNLFSIEPEKIQEISPVGSGDVLWGGLWYGILEKGQRPEEALLTAIPWATANAASDGVCTFTPGEWPALAETVLHWYGRLR